MKKLRLFGAALALSTLSAQAVSAACSYAGNGVGAQAYYSGGKTYWSMTYWENGEQVTVRDELDGDATALYCAIFQEVCTVTVSG